ncbi:hypothetical protein [Anaerotignum sp.]
MAISVDLQAMTKTTGRNLSAMPLQNWLCGERQKEKTLHLQGPHIYENDFIFWFYPVLLNVQSKPN